MEKWRLFRPVRWRLMDGKLILGILVSVAQHPAFQFSALSRAPGLESSQQNGIAWIDDVSLLKLCTSME
jgi:hypothetical protein